MKKIELKDEIVLEIIDLLKNTDTSYDYICTKYNLKKHIISSINTGKTYNHLNTGKNYPIRKSSVRNPKNSMIDMLTKKEITEIIQLLNEGKVKFEDIGKQYNINRHCVAQINKGEFDHSFLKNIEFPIRTKHIRQEKGNNSIKFTEKEIKKIVNLIKNTDIPFTEIALTYNTTSWTISMINTGKRYTTLLNNETFPLRKNTASKQNIISKLSHKDIVSIIHLLKNSNDSLRAIARQFNIDNSVIVRINNGKAWTNITSQYTQKYPIRTK